MAKETPSARGVRVIREIASKPLTDGDAAAGIGATPAASQQSAKERHARIAEIAYRNADKRGFAPGGELDDWLTAEREFEAGAGASHRT
jgi:Protein of unknown function (DUF2934)